MGQYDQTGSDVLMSGGGVRGRFFGIVLRAGVRIAALLLVALVAMILIRFGPGFENDERDLDPSLSKESRAARHERRLAEGQLTPLAKTFITGALHGDLGDSNSLGMPVRDLIADRGPATLRILLVGTGSAWVIGLFWAVVSGLVRSPILNGISTLASACLLCLPTAVIAALLLYANCPAEAVLTVALVPRVFQVLRGLIAEAVDFGDVLAARARGLGAIRILGWHVLPRIAAPMLAWFAATAGMAIGAVVPIEVICDVPGLGQLAWKAALARDLPVLVVLTLMVAILIQLSNGASSFAAGRLRGARV
jgi:peptide/nickel transport system permease protein